MTPHVGSPMRKFEDNKQRFRTLLTIGPERGP